MAHSIPIIRALAGALLLISLENMMPDERRLNSSSAEKYNYVFDFENQILDINFDIKKIKKNIIDQRKYAIAYLAIAGAQIFDPKKTTYKYLHGEFYLDVYFEQPGLGLLFITKDNEYSPEYLEKLQTYCDFYKIKLGLIYLNSAVQIDDIYVSSDGIIYSSFSGKDSLTNLDNKVRDLAGTTLRTFLPKLFKYKDELYEQMDKDLCKRLAFLLSLKTK